MWNGVVGRRLEVLILMVSILGSILGTNVVHAFTFLSLILFTVDFGLMNSKFWKNKENL